MRRDEEKKEKGREEKGWQRGGTGTRKHKNNPKRRIHVPKSCVHKSLILESTKEMILKYM